MTGQSKKKECQICGKSVLHLPEHMKIHDEQKPFKCALCEKSFKISELLTQGDTIRYMMKIHRQGGIQVCFCPPTPHFDQGLLHFGPEDVTKILEKIWEKFLLTTWGGR